MKSISHTSECPSRLTLIAVAVISSVAATPTFAEELLTIKLFRDSEVMFRDADMSRWADNYVELGVGYNSKDSLRFGQFSGLTDKGGFPLGGFNWISRGDTNDAQYWQVHGANLGLDSRKLKVEGGEQGLWNATFSFDGLKKSQTDTARFIYTGLGTSNLTLAPGCAAAANATLLTAGCMASATQFNIQQGRDIYRLGLNAALASDWDFKVRYREDRRDGTRLVGATHSGATARAAILPYQIDDKTQQVEAILSYATKQAQFQLGYHYSRFENALNSFTWANAFTGTTAGTTINRLSLAPSNDYHQINATGAYNFSKATRLTSKFSYGIARQNEAFLPYTTNPGAIAIPMPRASLEGKVVNTMLDIALTTKPMDKMSLKVAYQYRDSDNKTPIAQYVYASRDGTQGALGTASVRSNAPVSTTEHKFILDGDYEIMDKTVLRAGVEHNDKKYTLTDRTRTQTDKLSLDLRRPIGKDFVGNVGYAHTVRYGADYDKNTFFRNTYTDAAFQAANRLTNNPSMRSFMYADYDENRVRASGNWTLSETVTFQSSIDVFRQDARGPNCGQYADALQQLGVTGPLSDTCLGRNRAEGGSLNFDVQFQPEENLTTFAFLNLAESGIDQTGRTWTRNNTSGALDTNNWYGRMAYLDRSLGFGLKYQPEEKWDLGGTYVFNQGVGKSGVNTASGLAAASPLPDTWTRLHSLQLFAKMAYSKQMDLRFNYMYENLRAYDWAYDNVSANSVQNVLLNGMTSPRYSNHVFGVSAVMKHW
ncbi:MAG: MtrB/PioB family decaheme-associated outer membrane protein [Rhodocyclales bacterium]|nr:MtrB/PioB family decaheme-associated outer membrane protein [Rhodocyclales bacterium]